MSVKTSKLAVKAMGLFGGVQVLGILCSIVRTKLVAMWIGPVGVGLFGIFNNVLEMINTGTNLGVRNSSVRDISQACDGSNTSTVARIVAVVRRWSLWLGLAGALLTLAIAPALSKLTFGTDRYLWGFVALSVAVLLMAITNGEQAVLQGTGRLRRLATASLWGTLGGLLISVPMFYWLRERSVVPSIVAYAACNLVAAWLLRNRDLPAVHVTSRETIAMGSSFVKLGIYMTIGTFASIVSGYAFNAWLNHAAGTGEVGFYQAGYTLINRYTGLLFTALGMEYYPRLARVAGSRLRLRVFVSQEVNIAMMVLAPIAVLFILLRGPIVWVLYTQEFSVIYTYLALGMIGMVLRALSWCMAFVILAKGDGLIYAITEVLSALVTVALNIVCYKWWGLTGLGVAFLLSYVFYTVMVAAVAIWQYRLSLSPGAIVNTAWAMAVTVTAMILMEHGMIIPTIIIAVITICIALWQARNIWRR